MSHVIAAVSTGTAVSAIGIIRLSGDDCVKVADKVFMLNNGKSLAEAPDRKLLLGQLKDKQGRVIDQCMAVYSRGPRSYTGEDTVEFHCHGSPAVLAAGLESLYIAGALPAKRGEFTKRAFLGGKLDLTQAEAVIDLIEADTADAAANAAGQVDGKLQKKLRPIYDSLVDLCSHFHAVLDYPDEDIEDFGLQNYYNQLKASSKALNLILQTYNQGRILRRFVLLSVRLPSLTRWFPLSAVPLIRIRACRRCWMQLSISCLLLWTFPQSRVSTPRPRKRTSVLLTITLPSPLWHSRS